MVSGFLFGLAARINQQTICHYCKMLSRCARFSVRLHNLDDSQLGQDHFANVPTDSRRLR